MVQFARYNHGPYTYNYGLTHFRTPYIVKTTYEYLMDSMAWHLFKKTSASATADDAIQNTWSTCSAEVALFKELLQVCFLQAFLQEPFQRDSHTTKIQQSSNNCSFLCRQIQWVHGWQKHRTQKGFYLASDSSACSHCVSSCMRLYVFNYFNIS